VKYSEGLVADDDEVRVIGVKKKYILFKEETRLM
jgi:hypothetical protein